MLLQQALRHHGQDPFALYHMGDEGKAGRPAFPYRYKHFLMACAAVSGEQVIQESSMAFGGTSTSGGDSRKDNGPAPGRNERKRRGR